jgi:hypothetical protein
MASVSAPVTVTASAWFPPDSRSKPARLTVFGWPFGRVRMDRGHLRLEAGGAGPVRMPLVSKKETNFRE